MKTFTTTDLFLIVIAVSWFLKIDIQQLGALDYPAFLAIALWIFLSLGKIMRNI